MSQNELVLRPFEDGDIDLVGGWLAAPHVLRWFEHPEDWYQVTEPKKTFSLDYLIGEEKDYYRKALI